MYAVVQALTGIVEIQFARLTGFFVFPSMFRVIVLSLRFTSTAFSQLIVQFTPGDAM